MIQPENELELAASCKRGDEESLFLPELTLFDYGEKWPVCYRYAGRTVRLSVVADAPCWHQRLAGDYNRSAHVSLFVRVLSYA